jgi:hypothetical protein
VFSISNIIFLILFLACVILPDIKKWRIYKNKYSHFSIALWVVITLIFESIVHPEYVVDTQTLILVIILFIVGLYWGFKHLNRIKKLEGK